MCKEHWFKLPKEMRDAVWSAYEPGQEITKTPSKEYLKVTAEAIDWLANREQEVAREQLADQLFNEFLR